MRGDIVAVLEGSDHDSLLMLLFEASLSVGVDAPLGEDVCAGTSCGDKLC